MKPYSPTDTPMDKFISAAELYNQLLEALHRELSDDSDVQVLIAIVGSQNRGLLTALKQTQEH